MIRYSEPKAGTEADRTPGEPAPGVAGPEESEVPIAASGPAAQMEGAVREVSGKFEQVRHMVQRDMARRAAEIEKDIASDETERDRLHDDLKEGDIETLRVMTVDQQSKYDVYTGSNGPASTRPFDE